jgi:hypothetical protein
MIHCRMPHRIIHAALASSKKLMTFESMKNLSKCQKHYQNIVTMKIRQEVKVV